MGKKIERVFVPEGAAAALVSAAEVLGRDLGTVRVGAAAGADLVMHSPGEIRLPRFAEEVAKRKAGGDWHFILTVDGVRHVTGATARSVAHAVLALRDVAETGAAIVTAEDGFHAAVLEERLVTWDLLCNQTSRMCRGFDRGKHFEEACRIGLTSVEINRSPDQNVYQVTHLKRPEDPYPWVNDYGLALDMFAESGLNRGTYPAEGIARNRADLVAAGNEAAKWGLVPMMMCYEPRWVPESFFQKYPRLRGWRVDYPGRSFEPRYTMDIAQDRVLEHYRELMGSVCEAVPELGYLHLWTVDSGCGYAYMEGLYPGPNGTRWAKLKGFGPMVRDFLKTLADEGRQHNPLFKVIQANTWEFSDREWAELLKVLPEGAEVSHAVGVDEWRPLRDKELYSYGGLPGGANNAGKTTQMAAEDRAAGHEPYLEISTSCAWDLEPCVGTQYPRILAKKFETLRGLGAKRFMCRFGITSPPMVSRSINQDLMRDEFFGHRATDEVVEDRARAWSGKDGALVAESWRVLDRAIASIPCSTYFAPGWALSNWGQWLTRPLVPDRTRLNVEELEELTTHEFYLDDDPGRVNIFFEGYQRIMREDDSGWFVQVMDEDCLAPLDGMLKKMTGLKGFAGEVRDRLQAHRHIIACYRNWFCGQRSINLALLENRANPLASGHAAELRSAIELEIQNLTGLAELLDRSEHVLLEETERARNVYRYAQIARFLRKKCRVMQAHVNDPPGPWMEHLVRSRERLSRPRQPGSAGKAPTD